DFKYNHANRSTSKKYRNRNRDYRTRSNAFNHAFKCTYGSDATRSNIGFEYDGRICKIDCCFTRNFCKKRTSFGYFRRPCVCAITRRLPYDKSFTNKSKCRLYASERIERFASSKYEGNGRSTSRNAFVANKKTCVRRKIAINTHFTFSSFYEFHEKKFVGGSSGFWCGK